jgi:hypothetical protein
MFGAVMEWEGARSSDRSLGRNPGFFGEHYRNIVFDGVNAAAGLAFETGQIGRVLDRRLAHRADEDVEQVLRDRHWALRTSRKHCNKKQA